LNQLLNSFGFQEYLIVILVTCHGDRVKSLKVI